MSNMKMYDLTQSTPTNFPSPDDYEYNSSDSDGDIDYELEDDTVFDRSMDITLVFAYSITFLLGLFGNSVVIFITGCRVKKTMKSLWFLNLAITNLIFILFLPLKITEMGLYHHWPFGKVLCKLDNMVTVLNMFASAFFLAVITLDYLLTEVWSTLSQKYRTVKTASVIVLMIWVLTIILSAPSFVFIDILPHNNSKDVCIDDYLIGEIDTDEDYQKSLSHMRELVLTITQFLFGYLIPFVIIIACCVITEVKSQSCRFIKTNKPFKIIAALNIAFFICWIPYHVFIFLQLASTDFDDLNTTTKKVVRVGNTLAFSLAFFYSCINPILYFCMGEDFRE